MIRTYSIAEFLNIKDSSKSLHINRLENMPPLPANIQTPHKHNFHELIFIAEGTTIQNIDFKTYEVNTPSIFFISEGQMHFWERKDRETLRGYRLMFSDDIFTAPELKNFLFRLQFLNNIYQYPCLELNEAQQERIFTYMNLLFAEYSNYPVNNYYNQALMYLSMIEIERILISNTNQNIISSKIEIFKKCTILMEQNLTMNLTVNSLADQLHITTRHLLRVVREITGKNLKLLIQERIILELKRLLMFSNISITEIADKFEFNDSSYFARYFRRMTGQSPTEFKNQTWRLYDHR